MNLRISLLLALCVLPSTLPLAEATSSAPEDMNYLMHAISGLRRDSRLSVEKERKRQNSYSKEFLDSLPEMAANTQLDASVAALMQEMFAIGRDELEIINSKATPFHGNSSDEVFFIQDKKNDQRYVVKAFKDIDDPNSSFLPEFSAIAFLIHKQMPHLRSVKPFALRKCTIDQTCYGLLLESEARGVRVDQLVLDVCAYAQSSERRRTKLEEAQEMFYAMGRAFAELHESSLSEWGTLSMENRQKMAKVLTKLDDPSIEKKLQGHIDVKKLKNYGQQIMEIALNTPFMCTYQHGSAHLKNIFYDPSDGTITFIDGANLHASIDTAGAPLADGAYDLIRLQEYLTRMTLGTLTQEEVHLLMQSLFEGYQARRPLPDESLLEFYTGYFLISRLIKNCDFDYYPEGAERQKRLLIFETYARLLKSK